MGNSCRGGASPAAAPSGSVFGGGRDNEIDQPRRGDVGLLEAGQLPELFRRCDVQRWNIVEGGGAQLLETSPLVKHFTGPAIDHDADALCLAGHNRSRHPAAVLAYLHPLSEFGIVMETGDHDVFCINLLVSAIE